MFKRNVLAMFLILLGLFFMSCGSGPDTVGLPLSYPMVYTPWMEEDEYLDHVEFNMPIELSLYSKLVILPLNAENARIDEDASESEMMMEAYNAGTYQDEDNSFQYYFGFMDVMDTVHWEQISIMNEYSKIPVVLGDHAPDGERVLLLETNVLLIDPGSKAMRQHIGFGGSTELEIEGRIIDSKTGDVLVRYTDSDTGIGMGHAFGGEANDLLIENMETVAGEGIVVLLNSLLGE